MHCACLGWRNGASHFAFAFYLIDLGVEAYYIGESYKGIDAIRSFTYTEGIESGRRLNT